MKFPLPILATALAPLAAGQSAQAAVNVGDHLPAETHFAFWVDDLEAAGERTAQNPWLRAMLGEGTETGEGAIQAPRLLASLPISTADPVAPFWNIFFPTAAANLSGGIESASDVFNLHPKDIVETFTGSFALYSTLYDLYVQNGTPIVEWDVVLAAEFEEDQREQVEEFLEKALARVPQSAKKEKVRYSGHEVFHITYFMDEQAPLPGDEPVNLDADLIQEIPIIIEYAFVDNVFLLAEGRYEPLRRAVRALQRDGEDFRLRRQEGFSAAHEALKDASGDYHLYVDLNHHVREWADWPHRRGDLQAIRALGFGDSGPFLARVDADAQALRFTSAVVDPENPGGVFTLLSESPENDLQSLDIIPPDAQTLGSMSIDLNRTFALLEGLAGNAAGAQSALLISVLQNLERLTGVNVRSQLLEGSKGEMISYLRPDATRDAVADRTPLTGGMMLPLDGDQETLQAFNSIMRQLTSEQTMMLDLEPEEIRGVTLWESPQTVTGRGPQFAFAATPKGLLIANSKAEGRALLRRTLDDPQETIRQDEGIARFLEQLPRQHLRGFAYIPARVVREELGGLPIMTRPDRKELSSEELRTAAGPIWWALQAEPGVLRMHYEIESGD